jgi:hypothetical protein
MVSDSEIGDVKTKIKVQLGMSNGKNFDDNIETLLFSILRNVEGIAKSHTALEEDRKVSGEIMADICAVLESMDNKLKAGFGTSELKNAMDEYTEEQGAAMKAFISAFKNSSYYSEKLSVEEFNKYVTEQAIKTLNAAKEQDTAAESLQNNTTQVRKVYNRSKPYSEEEKAYLLDEKNSLEDLMKRFGYKNKNTAYQARAYQKKVAAKRAGKS